MNSNALNNIYKYFKNYYKFQHTETALRYSQIVAEMRKRKLENSKILEIGSGSTGITPYLKKKITGIDVSFAGPKSDLVEKIKGEAYSLPFKKNSWDVTISVDVLEHLDPKLREKAICEMLRVTKYVAFIVVPVGDDSENQDLKLQKIWQKKFKTKNQFLDEHVRNGLPKVEELLVFIDKALRKLDKKANIKSKPLLNLFIRQIIMRTWITKHKYLYYLYMKGYLPLVPILKYANFGKTYRRFFVIEFQL